MPNDAEPLEIFNRKRRRALRNRAGLRGNPSFLWQYVADDLSDRLVDVSRSFESALIIGPMAQFAQQILVQRAAAVSLAVLSEAERIDASTAIIEEDQLPFTAASFDLVICAGTLDSVNDLPGALVQIRRCLRPDGLFLGHMFGAGTLAQLKTSLLGAEQNGAASHIHPQVDLRSAADLLTRTGFALPVVDSDTTTVRYSDWRRLVDDVRDMGVGNSLAGPRRYLGGCFNDLLTASWSTCAAPDGKVAEQFVHIHMSGWAPSDDQPKPAKRGSANMSLASILPPSPPSV
jgi:NADH dehydrogenase [ubiquinone] 1 alpha subcomplex assembly factor 5